MQIMASVRSIITSSLLAIFALPFAHADETEVSPIAKVLQLISDLQSKIIHEGETAHKLYEETAAWCEDRSKDLQFEIKTGEAESKQLKAVIDKETATMSALEVKIEELSSDIAQAESDLKGATQIRKEEAADFVAEETELTDIIDMLTRAISIIEKEIAKGGAAMLQLRHAQNITQTLSLLVEASSLRSADAAKLTALVQTAQGSEESDGDEMDDVNAPSAAVYKGHSSGIVETLEDLLEKAQGQLAAARKKETSARNNYEMMKQSKENEISNSNKDMAKAKKDSSASKEAKSTAEGSLTAVTKELQADKTSLEELHTDCMTTARDYEAGVKSRSEEMKAVTAAKKVIQEETSGAGEATYSMSQASFTQVAARSASKDTAPFHAERLVRNMARKHHSQALMQLAKRMASALQSGSRSRSGDDPFAKIRGLVSDMIAKLEDEAGADAQHKAYCDKEMAEAKTTQEEKINEVEALSTKIDQMNSAVAKLNEEIRALQKSLAGLATSQQSLDKIRQEENAEYKKVSADLELGIEGVKQALKVLNKYYAKDDKDHDAGEGAASGIIGFLEVIESDFSKGLAEATAEEEDRSSSYEGITKDNELERAAKVQDVKYKTKEMISLQKGTSDTSSDRSDTQAELDAVEEALKKLENQCVAKPEPYEERKKRREEELAGLKQALATLDGEAVLLEQGSTRHQLRAGSRKSRNSMA